MFLALLPCAQHDLLWEELSGREHLRFYGRLKGLMGEAAHEAFAQALSADLARTHRGSGHFLSMHRHICVCCVCVCVTGRELEDAVDDALKAVNLYNGGVGNKFAGKAGVKYTVT